MFLHLNCAFTFQSQNYRDDLVQLLLKRGGHIDQSNSEGQRPMLLLAKLPACHIHPLRYVNLKCLAAAVIQANQINYKSEVPVSLEPFIQMH